MEPATYNVLFVCSDNSARSILAEALMNALGHGRFVAWSAGSRPSGRVHPMALRVLDEHGLSNDGWHSKGWEQFAAADAPQLHFIITLCDEAGGETCPVWPGQPLSAHWGVADPALVEGEAARHHAFVETFVTLKRRIELMLALPLTTLDHLALHHEIKGLGQR